MGYAVAASKSKVIGAQSGILKMKRCQMRDLRHELARQMRAKAAAAAEKEKLFKQITALRAENRRLRRENKWQVMAAEKSQARVRELEAELAAVRPQKRVRQPRPSPPATTSVDWFTWSLLGAGRLLQNCEEARRWEGLAVDWSLKGLPRGIVPKTKYWDRGLALDWSADGLPTLPFKFRPPRACHAAAPATPMAVDWWVFDLLAAPAQQLVAQGRPARLLEEEEMVVDWSGQYLPGQAGRPCHQVAGRRYSRQDHKSLKKASPLLAPAPAPQLPALPTLLRRPQQPLAAKVRPLSKPKPVIMQPRQRSRGMKA